MFFIMSVNQGRKNIGHHQLVICDKCGQYGRYEVLMTYMYLNLFFIPKIGYLAAAYTTLIGYLVLLLLHMYLVKRLGLKEIYDYNFIGIVVLIGIVLMILITILYSYIILRYVLTVVYGCLAIYLFMKYKDKIKGLLKKRS